MDRDAIPSDLRDHREEIRGRYRIERLGLFGSAARDELTESSDVDVLVTLSLVFPWKQNIQGWAKPPGTAACPTQRRVPYRQLPAVHTVHRVHPVYNGYPRTRRRRQPGIGT